MLKSSLPFCGIIAGGTVNTNASSITVISDRHRSTTMSRSTHPALARPGHLAHRPRRSPSMSSSPLRSLGKPSFLIMLSIAWGAMVTGTNAFASPTVGPQELKDQLHGLQANSFTQISCSRDQFNKCVKFCIDSQIHRRGTYSEAGCKKYCRENASSQTGCP